MSFHFVCRLAKDEEIWVSAKEQELDSCQVAILIPCYNEGLTISKVVCDFLAVLPKAQVYVFDNNSQDNSVELVEKLQKEHSLGKQIHLYHERRQGKGNVVRSMFRQVEADVYLMVDGDCTYDPTVAPELIKKVVCEKYDMVIGDRLSSTYFQENKRPFHNFGNVLVRKLVNMFFNCSKKAEKITDIMTGYRAMSLSFVKTMPVLSKGFEIETEMTIHALEHNFLVAAIPINYQDRPEGSSSKLRTYYDGAKVVSLIFKLLSEVKPLLFFGTLSLMLFILACLFLAPVLYEYFATSYVSKVPTFIASVVFLMLSTFSFFTGVILQILHNNHRRMFELMCNYHFHELPSERRYKS